MDGQYRIANYGGGRYIAEICIDSFWNKWRLLGTYENREAAIEAVNAHDRDRTLVNSRMESGTLKYELIDPAWKLGGVSKNQDLLPPPPSEGEMK